MSDEAKSPLEAWEREVLRPALERQPERRPAFHTASGLPLERIYLPAEDLVRFGVTEEALREGTVTPQVRALMEFQCARARDYYRRAAACLPQADARSLVAAQIMGGIYLEILERIERAGYDVFHQRIRVPRPYRALIALRIWAQSLLPRL